MDSDDLRRIYTEIHAAPRRKKSTRVKVDHFIVEAGRRGAEIEGIPFDEFVSLAIIDRLEKLENRND